MSEAASCYSIGMEWRVTLHFEVPWSLYRFQASGFADACMLAVHPLCWRTFDLQPNDQMFGYGFQAELPEATLVIEGSSQLLRIIFRPIQHTQGSKQLFTELLRAFFDITQQRRIGKFEFSANARFELRERQATSTYFDHFRPEDGPENVTFSSKIQLESAEAIRLEHTTGPYIVRAGVEPVVRSEDLVFFYLFFEAPMQKVDGEKSVQNAECVAKKLLQTEQLCLQYLGLDLYTQET